MCFVLVECETIVCFYEYDFESLYDPLGTFGEIERISVGWLVEGPLLLLLLLLLY